MDPEPEQLPSVKFDPADHTIFLTALELLARGGSLTAPQRDAVEQAARHDARRLLLKMRASGLLPHLDVALVGFHTLCWVSGGQAQPETKLLYALLSLRKAEERGLWTAAVRELHPEAAEASEREQGNWYRTGMHAARDYYAVVGYGADGDASDLRDLVGGMDRSYPGLAAITLTDQVLTWLRPPLDLEWPRGDSGPARSAPAPSIGPAGPSTKGAQGGNTGLPEGEVTEEEDDIETQGLA